MLDLWLVVDQPSCRALCGGNCVVSVAGSGGGGERWFAKVRRSLASLVEGRALAGHVDLSRFSVGQWLVWRGIHEAP